MNGKTFEFDWNRNVEELLTETRQLLTDISAATGYRIVRNGKKGEKMNNILPPSSDRRIAFICPKMTRRCFTLAIRREYLPAVKESGAGHTDNPKEIKQGRCPNWVKFDGLELEDLWLAVKAIASINDVIL